MSDPDALIQEIFFPIFAQWDKLEGFNKGKVKAEAYKYAPKNDARDRKAGAGCSG